MKRRQRGFTLIEVVLAFALLSVGLGLLVAIQGGGLRQVHTAAEVGEATQHAQSLLDTLGVMERIEPGRERGEFDGGRYRWELEIEEVPDPAPGASDDEAASGAAAPVPGTGGSGSGQADAPGRGAELAPAAGDLVALEALAAARPRLYRIVLDVRWGQGEYQRLLRFATLRARQPLLGEPAP